MIQQRGFALLAMLWFVAALAAVASAGVLAIRGAGTSATNRIELVGRRWAAEACASVGLARLDSVLQTGRGLIVLDTTSIRLDSSHHCAIGMSDLGARINPDSAGPAAMERLTRLAAEAQIPIDSFLTRLGDGRVNVNTAGFEVLTSLPGVSTELARNVIQRRGWSQRLGSLADLAALAMGSSRDSLTAHMPELHRMVTFAPSTLSVLATGSGPRALPRVAIEMVVRSAGPRAAVVRRRMW